MDDTEIELLRKLLSNDEVKETLKKILLEESENIKVKKATKKTTAKKTATKKPEVKKPTPKKTTPKKTTLKNPVFKKVTDKNSREYGRSYFVDNLTESIVETINGKKVDLAKNSKRLSKLINPPKARDKAEEPKSVCGQCNTKFVGFGYMCNECLRGKNVE